MTIEAVLRAYPDIDRSLDLPGILWPDPLFCPNTKTYFSLPQPVLDARREYLLRKLNHYGAALKECDHTRQFAIRESWWRNILRQHVPLEVYRKICIEAAVNDMDPDFSYWRAVCAQMGLPDPGPDIDGP